MIEAKIIADSLGPFNDRIITYILTFPRIVLAEFNTHRALSRNSASSRAIPSKKMLKMVKENPFIPIKWMKEHTGMQGVEYIPEVWTDLAREEWLTARSLAVKQAEILSTEYHVTKQICNRLLEPFMWHTCIATATEWENFFALRAHPDAEIHIQDLAFKMLEAANASTPKKLAPYEWHIPFGDRFDDERIVRELIPDARAIATSWNDPVLKHYIEQEKLRIATARCARVSYLNFEGKDNYEDDVRLYDRLLKAGHLSPFEHCAQAMSENAYFGNLCDTKFLGGDDYGNAVYDYGWSGNFKGFFQLRKTLLNENKKDERFIRVGN